MPLKAVVFDLDGVYFLNGTENFLLAVTERFHCSHEKAEKLYKTSNPMMKKYKLGQIRGGQYWEYFIRELKIKSSPDELLKLLVAGYELNQPAEDLRSTLGRRGIKCCLCSNNFPERIIALDQRFRFLGKFSAKIFSYEVGILKPDRAIFERLVQASGVQPSEIFFADDRAENLVEAEKMGIKTAVFQSFGDFENKIAQYL